MSRGSVPLTLSPRVAAPVGPDLAPAARAALANAELLSQLDAPRLTAVANAARVRTMAAGEDVFRDGQTADAVFVILKGRVKVMKHGSELDDHPTVGRLLGAQALGGSTTRGATVTATEPTELLAIPLSALTAANAAFQTAGEQLARDRREAVAALGQEPGHAAHSGFEQAR
jgi:CRP-like cAMP-binding protein